MTRADLEALGYTVDVAPDGDTAAVRGYGIATMVNRADAAEVFAALADPAGHAERRFQFLQPDAHAARGELEQTGYTIARVDPSTDSFAVTAPKGGPPVRISPATPDQLVALADAMRPPPPRPRP